MVVESGVDRHLDITFGLQVVESSSLISVLFIYSKWFLCYLFPYFKMASASTPSLNEPARASF